MFFAAKNLLRAKKESRGSRASFGKAQELIGDARLCGVRRVVMPWLLLLLLGIVALIGFVRFTAMASFSVLILDLCLCKVA